MIVGIIHARMQSSRLPGKVLKNFKGKSSFYHHYKRLSQCKNIDRIYLATSKNESNTPLVEEAERYNIPYYMGAEEDVLERYIAIAQMEEATTIVRCGCDKPLVSYEILDELFDTYEGEDLLYITTPLPRGIGSEILSYSALIKIRQHYRGPAISKYIFENPHLFKVRGVDVHDSFSHPEFRLSLDTKEDYHLISHLYDKFYEEGVLVNLQQVFRYLDDHPQLANVNRFIEDSPVNTYVDELKDKPVFSIYQGKDGQYIVKNRMGETLSKDEVKHIVSNRLLL